MDRQKGGFGFVGWWQCPGGRDGADVEEEAVQRFKGSKGRCCVTVFPSPVGLLGKTASGLCAGTPFICEYMGTICLLCERNST